MTGITVRDRKRMRAVERRTGWTLHQSPQGVTWAADPVNPGVSVRAASPAGAEQAIAELEGRRAA